MYLCRQCNSTFEEPSHWQESHDLDYPLYEHFLGCPMCRDNDYIELLWRCDICGSPIIDEYVELVDGLKACSKCFEVKEIW